MGILKKIPETSINNYISGYYSLNTPDINDITADWHPRLYWYSNNKNEKIPLYNTNNIFSNEGIEYREVNIFSDEQNKKYYIANHVRAIADLVATLDDIRELRGCVNDWLMIETQEKELYELLLKIKDKDIDWFLKEEFAKYHLGGIQ